MLLACKLDWRDGNCNWKIQWHRMVTEEIETGNLKANLQGCRLFGALDTRNECNVFVKESGQWHQRSDDQNSEWEGKFLQVEGLIVALHLEAFLVVTQSAGLKVYRVTLPIVRQSERMGPKWPIFKKSKINRRFKFKFKLDYDFLRSKINRRMKWLFND